jgi:hypothetical protein
VFVGVSLRAAVQIVLRSDECIILESQKVKQLII